MIKKSLKAQFSTFIIISAIIVLGIVFILILNTNKVEIFNDEKSSSKVKDFMESCLIQESKDAIDKLGASGGWLYPAPKIYTDRSLPQEFNKRAQGLNLLEKQKMPYWYYYDDSNEKFVSEIGSTIPFYDTESPYSMKNQLKRYVNENIENNCIQNFNAFKDIYNIDYDRQKIEVDVEMTEDKIEVGLNLPLEITEINGESKEFIEYFKIETDNKLYMPYLIARDIVLAEANTSFVEERMVDFITPYQSASKRDALPPFYDFRMTYDYRPWDVQKVSQLTKDIIGTNMGLIQFANTDYENQILRPGLETNKFAQSFIQIYIKDYLSETSVVLKEDKKLFEKYKNYKVTPVYESRLFPSYFSLDPSMGNYILLPRPQALLGFLPFFFTEYVASYEITTPIVFEIKSNDPNDRFVFNLPIEANVKHNTPLRSNLVYDFGLENVDLSTAKTIICDPPQFISQPVFLNITDPINFGNRDLTKPASGVDGALITFTCSKVATCFVGQTKSYNKYTGNNLTELALKLPVGCDSGTIEVMKFNHRKLVIENVIPNTREPIQLGEFEMPSPKTLDVKLNLLLPQNENFAIGSELGEYEKGFIIFENNDDKDFVSIIQITPENQYNLTVDLIPGNYKITGFIVYDKKIVIPQEQICYEGGDECQTIEKIEMDSWIKGGIEIENFEASKYMILNRNQITINLIDYGVPQTFSELQLSSELIADVKELSLRKLPVFD